MKRFLILAVLPCASSLVFGGLGAREKLKADLLQLSHQTRRGLNETPEQREEVYNLFQRLEKLNPTRKPLKSELVNGLWALEYTTSDSILGRGDFPRVGPILQRIDTETLSAENSESVSYFGIKVPRKVSAKLSPENDRLTSVKFDRFTIGPFGIMAPDSFRGSLDVTYVDKDLRLTRGDKGNIFVLTRVDKESS